MGCSEGAGREGAARRAELAARRGVGLQGKFIRLRHPGEASSEIRAKGLMLTVCRRRVLLLLEMLYLLFLYRDTTVQMQINKQEELVLTAFSQ